MRIKSSDKVFLMCEAAEDLAIGDLVVYDGGCMARKASMEQGDPRAGISTEAVAKGAQVAVQVFGKFGGEAGDS